LKSGRLSLCGFLFSYFAVLVDCPSYMAKDKKGREVRDSAFQSGLLGTKFVHVITLSFVHSMPLGQPRPSS